MCWYLSNCTVRMILPQLDCSGKLVSTGLLVLRQDRIDRCLVGGRRQLIRLDLGYGVGVGVVAKDAVESVVNVCSHELFGRDVHPRRVETPLRSIVTCYEIN